MSLVHDQVKKLKVHIIGSLETWASQDHEVRERQNVEKEEKKATGGLANLEG